MSDRKPTSPLAATDLTDLRAAERVVAERVAAVSA